MHKCALIVLVILTSSIWSLSASAAPVQWSVNGHFYDVIDVSTNWDNAKIAAEAATFMGVQGHLATITSVGENLFLTNTFGASNLHVHWIGGFQPPASSEPAGGWSWVTSEPFIFSNWGPPSEPNNSSGVPGENEDGIAFDHGVTVNGKSWNDLPRTRNLNGYVVEFAVLAIGICGGATPFAVIGKRSLDVLENAVIIGDIASDPDAPVTVGKAARILDASGNAASGNAVSLAEWALIDGNVRANVAHLEHDATITGAVIPPPLSVGPLPTVSVTPGNLAVFVPKGGVQTLAPGAYLSIGTGKSAVIHFTGGQYDLAEVRIGKATTLMFHGATTINVRDQLELGEDVVLIAAAGLTSADIRFNYEGFADALFGKHTQGALTVVAPNALIRLDENGVYTGRIWGQSVRVGKAVQITGGACPEDPAACGGGVSCPGDQVCNRTDATCSVVDPPGTCVDRPQICLAVFLPVCGCDGVTYNNDCARVGAGAILAHPGGC